MTGGLKLSEPTWFVGCGNMGGAILDGWRMGGLDLSAVTVIRPSGKAVEGARVVTSVKEAGSPPKIAFLAFKPQNSMRSRRSCAAISAQTPWSSPSSPGSRQRAFASASRR